MTAAKDRKIVVPDGMLDAAYRESIKDADGIIRYSPTDGVRQLEQLGMKRILEAALAWLTDNLIVPSDEQISDMYSSASEAGISFTLVSRFIAEWQRRMFLAPEPAIPEEISDLVEGMSWDSSTWKLIVEAFNRGRKLGGQS